MYIYIYRERERHIYIYIYIYTYLLHIDDSSTGKLAHDMLSISDCIIVVHVLP